jgi:WD40 repeat protein
MLTVGQERSTLIEIDGGDKLSAVTFAANGEYLVSGGENGVRVWRVEDGEEIARLEASYVLCVAASKDGRWIAAGTLRGEVIVWDPERSEIVFALEEDGDIHGVDFSPDSTRLLFASRKGCRATVWDVATRKRVVGPLPHEKAVRAAKFSPQGDRIATVTQESVRVYDSNDGRLLMATLTVTPWCNTSLLWSKAHLFVVSNSKIKHIDASTGSSVSEWPVPDGSGVSCIALPTHGEFVAHSTSSTVTFWDASTRTQLGLIQHPQDVHLIALSPDDRFLAIGGEGGKITIKHLSRTMVSIVLHWIMAYLNKLCSDHLSTQYSIPFSQVHPTFREPDIQIDDAALDSWKHDELANADTLLTAAILESQNERHHVLASRALVQARLRQWDPAIVDAKEVSSPLFSCTLTLMLIYASPSTSSLPSLATLQRV